MRVSKGGIVEILHGDIVGDVLLFLDNILNCTNHAANVSRSVITKPQEREERIYSCVSRNRPGSYVFGMERKIIVPGVPNVFQRKTLLCRKQPVGDPKKQRAAIVLVGSHPIEKNRIISKLRIQVM